MIETERLVIKPLSYEQVTKYMRLDNSLETELKLSASSSRTISNDLKEALENSILPNVADSNRNYLYFTLWTVISKADNKMIGDLCFMGEPDENGEIEIGYGTYEEFRNQGFMTEAVSSIIKWAREQPYIRAITASTDKTNGDSISILQKNSFIRFSENDTLYNWRLKIK
jgi:RimJ/RimL family protein N-acetyltransferase